MILPHPDDVPALVAERNVPPEVADELQRLANYREATKLQIMHDKRGALGDAARMAGQVREEMLWSMYPDLASAIPWPWRSLEALVGRMLAGEHHLVAARTGVGKTTFLLNVIRHLVRIEHSPVRILPFETPPAKLLKLMAAVELRYDPRIVARSEWDKLPAAAPDAIEEHARLLTSPPVSYELTWGRQGSMTPVEVYRELDVAADLGCRIVVLDHLHRVAIDGRNQEAELRALMRQLKDRIEKLDITLLSGAQLNRGDRDPLRRYLPPLDTDLRGAGALEEEADGVYGLYLPLKEGVTAKQMAAVRRSLLKAKALVRPATTGVRVIKHRIDGALAGEDVFLDYDHGQLSDPPPPENDQRSAWP